MVILKGVWCYITVVLVHFPKCLNDIQHVFMNPAVDISSLEKRHIQTFDHLFGYLDFFFFPIE